MDIHTGVSSQDHPCWQSNRAFRRYIESANLLASFNFAEACNFSSADANSRMLIQGEHHSTWYGWQCVLFSQPVIATQLWTLSKSTP
ncbi:MAG: hypothetical protein H7252_02470 [Cytophaga sp.]|nr:hypothetical protein [Undibacterium sp.]